MTPIHQSFQAEVVDVELVARETKKFRCWESERKISFTPGQFFLLEVPEKDPSKKKAYRAYSVSTSYAHMPMFEIFVKRVPNGVATSFLWDVKEKDILSFQGPMGQFCMKDRNRKQAYIATGTGVAPMRSFWHSLMDMNTPPAPMMEGIFGFRDEEHILCERELRALSAISPKLSYSMCLSQPKKKDEKYFHGRVTDFVRQKKTPEDFQDTDIYLCGNKEMIKEMKDILTEKGVKPEGIAHESW
jgi:NAD(P)H-flavin reductase